MQNLEKIPPSVLAAYLDREIASLCLIVDQVIAANLKKKPAGSVKPKKKLEAYAGV